MPICFRYSTLRQNNEPSPGLAARTRQFGERAARAPPHVGAERGQDHGPIRASAWERPKRSCRRRQRVMNRGRLEPLGVPGSDLELSDKAAPGTPSALDRWVLKTAVSQLGPNSPVKAALWDEPDVTPRDGTVRVRILDRKALWMLAVNPDLHFGDLYSAGRVEVRGSLQLLLEEIYRASFGPSVLASVVGVIFGIGMSALLRAMLSAFGLDIPTTDLVIQARTIVAGLGGRGDRANRC